jgi:L-aminopeptidase/D-esterase-like protein
MFLIVLAATTALSGSHASAPQKTPVVEAVSQAVLVDCQVSGANLTDCKAVDADGVEAAAAVQMASQVEVPEAFALANPGRILIKMTVNP